MRFRIVYAKENLAMKYPKGYGLAYFDYMSQKAYLYPIPFNWIVKLARDFWYVLKEPSSGIKEAAWKEGYSTGVSDTWKIRKDAVKKEVLNELEEEFRKTWTK